MRLIDNPSLVLIQLYGPMQPPDAEPISIEILKAAALDRFPSARIELQTLSVREGDIGIQRVLELVPKHIPIIVGISVPQSTFDLAISLIHAIYHKNQESNIVLGHALPTHSPELFLKVFPKVIIVRGWGEESFVQLIEYCAGNRSSSLKDIPNLCYTSQNDLQFTLSRWPDRMHKPFRLDSARYFSRVESSRGCQHDVCSFCTRQPRDHHYNAPWYRRPKTDVLEDIRDLTAIGRNYFTFTDEDFIGTDLEGAQEIARALCQIGNLHFSLSVRADNVYNPHGSYAENEQRRQLFELLTEAGLYLVYIGVESLSDTQLQRYGKGIKAEDNIRAVRTIQGMGIGLEMGFILFDALLTQTELVENVRWLDRSGLWANVGNLFNYLRPQKDAAYVRLLTMSELIGEYNQNAMSFSHQFADKEIGEVAESLISVEREVDPIYLLARNIERNSMSNGAYAHFVLGIRSLMFRLLRAFVQSRIERDEHLDQQEFLFFRAEREGIVRTLYRHLVAKGELTQTELALRHECEVFIQRGQRRPLTILPENAHLYFNQHLADQTPL